MMKHKCTMSFEGAVCQGAGKGHMEISHPGVLLWGCPLVCATEPYPTLAFAQALSDRGAGVWR